MSALATWQRMLYFLGETVMVGGLVWGLFHRFFVGGCPLSPFNFTTLIVAGLAFSTIPLHPFGARLYLAPWLRNQPVAAVLWWVLAIIGLAISLYLRLTAPVPQGLWWFYALVPAALYFFFAIPSQQGPKPAAPPRAPDPPPAPKDNAETDNDLTDPTEQGDPGDA